MKKWAFDPENGQNNGKIVDDEPSNHLEWSKATWISP